MLYEESVIFGKKSFINAKEVLNFVQSLINENKVIKSLTAFHIEMLKFDMQPNFTLFP